MLALFVSQDRAFSQSTRHSSPTTVRLRQVAYLKASNPGAADHFGCGGSLPGHIGTGVAISSDGSTIAVGAPHESSAAKGVNGNQNDDSLYSAGAVYVYTRSGDSWVQQAYIKASNTGQSDNFGSMVVLSGDGNTLAVSAVWESSATKGINGDQNDDSIAQAGAVYVFTRQGATWSQQAYIKASNTGRLPVPGNDNDWGDGDQFGFALAISADGNTLAAGAVAEDSRASGVNNMQDDDSAASSGAVYVFTRRGATWSQEAYIKASNADGGDLFGYNIGLSRDGNTMAVSGYDEDGSGRTVNAVPDNRRNGSGALYVFERTGTAWRQTAYLKGSRSENTDTLGYATVLSEDGNTIAGGAAEETCLVPGINPPGCDNDRTPGIPSVSSGAAYVWARTGNTWTEQAFLKASHPDMEDWFGVRLAISGDGNTLAVGAQNEDSKAQGIGGDELDNSAHESGAVYLFTRTGNTWTQAAYIKGSNTEAFDEFGSAIALNRDGTMMVIGARGEDGGAKGVNANQNDNSVDEAGAAYVFVRE
jgi:hypothetical protein